MRVLNKKLLWSALAIAVLTTPALAQHQHRLGSQATHARVQSPALQYPNGELKTGSARNAEYGAEYNLGR
jgi:hypothetical protein